MVYNMQQNTIDTSEPCPICGNNYRYINTGKCVTCTKKLTSNSSNMKLINKRRQLQKEKQLRDINRGYYFED